MGELEAFGRRACAELCQLRSRTWRPSLSRFQPQQRKPSALSRRQERTRRTTSEAPNATNAAADAGRSAALRRALVHRDDGEISRFSPPEPFAASASSLHVEPDRSAAAHDAPTPSAPARIAPSPPGPFELALVRSRLARHRGGRWRRAPAALRSSNRSAAS